MQWYHKKQFKSFIKSLIDHRSITFLLAFYHSYLGFCTELSNPFSPGLIYASNRIPIIICFPLFFDFAENTKKSQSKCGPDLSPHGYSNNFGEPGGVGTKEGVQHDIINVTFKNFVTKLMNQISWINRPENVSLHSDMRAFLTFIHNAHGNPFRRVVVSGLLLSIPKVENHRVEGKHYGR